MDESTLDFLAERKGFWSYPDDNDTTRERRFVFVLPTYNLPIDSNPKFHPKGTKSLEEAIVDKAEKLNIPLEKFIKSDEAKRIARESWKIPSKAHKCKHGQTYVDKEFRKKNKWKGKPRIRCIKHYEKNCCPPELKNGKEIPRGCKHHDGHDCCGVNKDGYLREWSQNDKTLFELKKHKCCIEPLSEELLGEINKWKNK